MASNMRMRGRKSVATISISLLLVACVCLADAYDDEDHHQHTRLFPASDEYDSRILDPATVNGSPFGGFSRATRSRLAGLPLRLPNIAIMDSDKNNDDDNGSNADDAKTTTRSSIHYMETTDGMGRKYVCRAYHEDELEPSSVTESIFDPPNGRQQQHSISGSNHDIEDSEEEDEDAEASLLEQLRIEALEEEEDELEAMSPDILLMETQRRLKALKGVCSQIHLGWWSYEVCFGQSVTQFHIHIDKTKSDLELKDLAGLGTFDKRFFQIPSHPKETEEHDDYFPAVNKFAEDEPEISRVADLYTNGDPCTDTGTPRRTKVNYFCCSERLGDRYKSPVLRDGISITSKIATIVSLQEVDVCLYAVSVCTPLLCEDIKSDYDDGLLFDIAVGSMIQKSAVSSSSPSPSTKASRSSSKSSRRTAPSKPRRENETIRDILDRTLGTACIQSSSTGWWSYEYCHQQHVRQFHEEIMINMETGASTTTTSDDDDIFFLGYYSEALDAYPDGDEWKYVVNATLPAPGSGGGDGAASSGNTAGSRGGQTMAAYFMTEYVGGNACDDDADVTDAAIKAGTIRSGHIERSSSVRFACGPQFDIYVKEDHTCHYIVDVTVPELCHHPAFQAPVPKKQIVKCLQVEDTKE